MLTCTAGDLNARIANSARGITARHTAAVQIAEKLI
jgi:hypothetical protein